jgi:hypothetical protein
VPEDKEFQKISQLMRAEIKWAIAAQTSKSFINLFKKTGKTTRIAPQTTKRDFGTKDM